MPDKFLWFLTLALFAGLSMNLILRFGIGLRQIAGEDDDWLSDRSGKTGNGVFIVRTGIYFASIMVLWLFFSFLQSVLFLGFFEYILVFPASSLFFTVLQYVAGRLILRTDWRGDLVSRNNFLSDCFFIEDFKGGARGTTGADAGASKGGEQTSHNGVFAGMVGGAPTGAAVFIISGLAGSVAQAATLSLGFSAGAATALLIVGEIRRRSATEAVPARLRGGPLVLITMGLLSLVFTSVAVVFYSVLGTN